MGDPGILQLFEANWILNFRSDGLRVVALMSVLIRLFVLSFAATRMAVNMLFTGKTT